MERPPLASATWYQGLCAAACALEARREQQSQQASGIVNTVNATQQSVAPGEGRDADATPQSNSNTAAERRKGASWQVILWKLKLPCQCGKGPRGTSQHRRRLHHKHPPHNRPFPDLPEVPPELPPLPPPPQLQELAKALSSGGVSIRIDTGRSGAVDVKIPAVPPGANGATPQSAGQQPQQQNGSPSPRAGVTLTELGVGPSPTAGRLLR